MCYFYAIDIKIDDSSKSSDRENSDNGESSDSENSESSDSENSDDGESSDSDLFFFYLVCNKTQPYIPSRKAVLCSKSM